MTMLTSSAASQFIHPDYLQPLPTTLDAKKSPLALLAQTCSSIGKDTNTPSKPIIPPLKKETNNDQKQSERLNSDKSKSIDIERKDKESDISDKPGFRTVSHKDIPPLIPTSKSKEEKPNSPLSLKTLPRSKDITSTVSSSVSSHLDQHSARSNITKSPGRHHSPHNEEEKRQVASASPRHDSRLNREPDEQKPSSYPSYSGYPSISNSFLSYSHAIGIPTESSITGLPGFPLSLPTHGMFGSSSAAAAALAAQSAAYAAQSSALKSAAMASSLSSPFVSYARVRTPSGATTLVPICRDPYCTHCQLTVQNSHLSATCTAVGCAQCAHEKSLHNLSMGLHASPFNPYSSSSLLSGQSSLSSYPLSSLYPPGSLPAHHHSGLPLVCNWVSSGNEHCGKRFSSSEELLQHLRTHTTSSDQLSIAAAYERYGLPPPVLPLPGLHGPTLPSGSLSPNSLRRNYPTSISPLSSLMGTSRYHPYKSFMSPSAALPSNQPLPQVGPYLSAYSLYGQRIGAAAVP